MVRRLLKLLGKVAAAIRAIPVPVMGGVCLLLFGIIAAAGIRMLVEQKVDYSKPRNLVLTSVVLTAGASGAAVKLGAVELKGMALGTTVAIVLSLLFWAFDRLGLSNDAEK